MFYLTEFFKVLKENLIIAGIFIVSTFSLITVSHNFSSIESNLADVSTKNGQPYFNALVDDSIKLSSVVRRMKSLPGVVSVESLKSMAIQNEVKALKKVYGEDLLKNLAVSSYKKIKIELEHGLKMKNQTLIREYLQRLIGKESVTIGNLKTPTKVKFEKGNVIQLITSWGKWYLIAVLAGLWLISIALLVKPLQKSSFIISKFQRSKNSYLKMAGIGIMTISIPVYIGNVLAAPKIELTSFIVMFAMFAIVLLTSAFSKR